MDEGLAGSPAEKLRALRSVRATRLSAPGCTVFIQVGCYILRICTNKLRVTPCSSSASYSFVDGEWCTLFKLHLCGRRRYRPEFE